MREANDADGSEKDCITKRRAGQTPARKLRQVVECLFAIPQRPPRSRAAMPRYVVLEHDHPELHWDFMLEAGEVLRTWRLAAPPGAEGAIPATAVFDHRPFYLDYEGPVRGGRGFVRRWDAGTFTWQ